MTIKLGDKVKVLNSIDGKTTHHIGKTFEITIYNDWEFPFYSSELEEWFAESELEIVESCSQHRHLILNTINDLFHELCELELELPNTTNQYVTKAIQQRVYVVEELIKIFKEQLETL